MNYLLYILGALIIGYFIGFIVGALYVEKVMKDTFKKLK